MKFSKGIAAITLALSAMGGLSVASPAAARDGYHDYRPGDYYEGRRGYRSDRYDRYDRRNYYRGGNYYRGDRYYRDSAYYRCDRDNGVGGTLIGAVAGGLLGHEVAGRGDRTGATIAGAVIGGVVGNVVDRGNDDCR